MVSFAHLLNENLPILLDFVHPTNSHAPVTPAHAENLFVKEGVGVACVCLREGVGGGWRVYEGSIGLPYTGKRDCTLSLGPREVRGMPAFLSGSLHF